MGRRFAQCYPTIILKSGLNGYLKQAADKIYGNGKAYSDDSFGVAATVPWSYVPPLMVYLAAGISGLTAIVGTFFVKDYLNLSAGFLASLGFWAGLPWRLKCR